MEHIYRCIVSHYPVHVAECIQEELPEASVLHMVVPYLPCTALIVHVVRRVGHDEVRLLTVHQTVHILLPRGVAYKEPVSSENPKVAGLREHRLLQLPVNVEVVVLDIVRPQQICKLLIGESGKGQVERLVLKVRQLDGEKFLVPSRIQGQLVVCDYVRPLLRLGEILLPDARNLVQPQLLGGIEPSMPA